MRIEFDANKNVTNIRERGLSFERVLDFDFETATFLLDNRREYGQVRQIAVGYLGGRLHVLCLVDIFAGIRVISFRKANDREARKYDKPKTIN